MSEPDPFQLSRFLDAQTRMHALALAELEAGEKQSHWMWFIFPQLRGLGFSPTARFFGIDTLAEAAAYLAHPVLGSRLLACTEAALAAGGSRSLRDIFGSPDDLKFRSSMTLFERAADGAGPFGRALDLLCGGERDGRTLERLSAEMRAEGEPRSTRDRGTRP